jgi:ectoine hydroxylase-related dioxygenase (phytanoyl-CoA dioxygenase family)
MRSELSSQQLERYARDGYLCPLEALAPAEAASHRVDAERMLAALSETTSAAEPVQCHLHFQWARELATHPRVLDNVERIIGPDILVHSTNLFYKPPRDSGFVSWHQDAHSWRLDAPRLVSAWIALTESNCDNGCLRVIPGSHSQPLPHASRPHPDNMLRLTALEVEVDVDDSEAVDLALAPGQMSLHHADVVHGSNPNRSASPRMGLAVRYVSPTVRQERWHHAVLVARGENTQGNYDSVEAPPPAEFEDALAAHVAFWDELVRRRSDAGTDLFAAPVHGS